MWPSECLLECTTQILLFTVFNVLFFSFVFGSCDKCQMLLVFSVVDHESTYFFSFNIFFSSKGIKCLPS